MALPTRRSRAEDVVVYVEDAIVQRGLRPGEHMPPIAAARLATRQAITHRLWATQLGITRADR
jgi:hypothetical protein